MNEPTQVSETCRGVYRAGIIRLLESVPWPDGVTVEVRLVSNQTAAAGTEVGPVIIAGFGLAGRAVAEIFEQHAIDYTVVEKNPDAVQQQRLLGRKIIHGDIAVPDVLEAAGIDNARILALTIPDEKDVLEATRQARRIKPDIYIVARTNYASSGLKASQLGADAVVKAEQAVAQYFHELMLRKIQP